VRVTFCGVRGSTPAPGPDFIRFGGNTSCVALSRDGDGPSLLLDGGTGLRRLSQILGDCPFRGTLLLTHLHWDHVQGLPFFLSGDRDDARVTLLLPAQDGPSDAEVLLARMMSPPFFPIEPRQLRGEWRFGLVPVGPFEAEGFTVMPMEVPHKGGRTLGFRVTDGRTSVAYIPDHCPTALGPGPEGWGEYHPAALALADGADALVHDAFWRPQEATAQAMLGHAVADYAVGLGQRAGAARIVLAHHKPDRTDTELDLLAARFRADGRVIVAAEGRVIDL